MLSYFLLAFVFLLQTSGTLATNVIYWGQNGQGSERNLAAYCTSDGFDTINIAFLNIFFDGNNGKNLPSINLANHCETTFPDYPGLLYCPDVATDIATCRANGKKILISLGGAEGVYGFTSEAQAKDFAKTMYDMFLGGSSVEVPRPFDDAVLDGIDLDIEGGSPLYYSDFVNALKVLDGSVLISAAPQCPLPDEWHDDAIKNAEFDYISIQFYNNYCSVGTSAFNIGDWSTSVNTNSKNTNVKLLIGAPASSAAAGSGYISAESLVNLYTESSQTYGNVDGIMLWSVGNSDANGGYMEKIVELLGGETGTPTETGTETDTATNTKTEPATETATNTGTPTRTRTCSRTPAPTHVTRKNCSCKFCNKKRRYANHRLSSK